jgi:hypothetical protein
MRLKCLLGENEKPMLAFGSVNDSMPHVLHKRKEQRGLFALEVEECLIHLEESQSHYTQLLCVLLFWNTMATKLNSMYIHLNKMTMVYLESTELLSFHCVLSPPGFPGLYSSTLSLLPLIQLVSTYGSRLLWGLNSLPQGLPKAIGKDKYLHCNP